MVKRLASTLSFAVVLGLLGSKPACLADAVTDRTTETTYAGVVTDINPDSRMIILKSDAADAPVTYTFSKETVFTDSAGTVISYEAVKDSPVTVYYTKDGDRVMVNRVVTSKPASKIIRKETTTTETR